MNFIKAAAGAAIACILSAGLSMTAMAEAAQPETISAGGETFEVVYGDSTEDAEYLEYKHRTIENAMTEKSPAGMVGGTYFQKRTLNEWGSSLVHDSRFDGMDRVIGIDVSQWQSEIDWNKVAKDDIEYAIIRVGYRGYGSAGTLVMDPYFEKNLKGAKEAGLKVGVYFYTQAINTKEAQQEADYCAAALKGAYLDLPVYYDIEGVDFDIGRLDSAGLSKKQKTELCKAFCDRIESYGYESGVYACKNWLENMINGPELGQNYNIWIAGYLYELDYAGTYDIWQYASDAVVDGISGYTDINVKYEISFAPTTEITAEVDNGMLSWNAAEGADGYTVYGYDDSGEFVVDDVTGTSYSISGLSAKQYSVAAYNVYGGKRHYGSKSARVDSYTETVFDLSAVRTGVDKLELSWSPAPGAMGYEVYVARDGDYRLVGRTNKCTYNLSDSNMHRCTAKIRPYDENGVAGHYSDELQLMGNLPSKVPALELNGTRLVWDKVEDADAYIVTFRIGDMSSTFNVEDTYFDIDDSRTGTYTVQAYNLLDGMKFRTAASNACEFNGVNYPPQGEIVLDSGEGELTWNKIDDAVGYIVYELTSDGEEVETARVEKCSYSSDDLTGAVYFVKGYNTKDGEEFYTEPSNKLVISLPEVTEVKIESSSDDCALISWNSIEGCDEYMVYLDKGDGYVVYSSVRGTKAMIGNLKNAEYACVRIKGYVGNENVVSYGLFSNRLFLVGDEDTPQEKEVFDFEDLITE